MYEKIRHRKLKYLPSVIPLANKFTENKQEIKLGEKMETQSQELTLPLALSLLWPSLLLPASFVLLLMSDPTQLPPPPVHRVFPFRCPPSLYFFLIHGMENQMGELPSSVLINV